MKAVIAAFVSTDWQMMNKEKGTSTKVKNMSIVEDLGMVHFVFADKTGTLTQNLMEFNSMCIGETEFGPKEQLLRPTSKGNNIPVVELQNKTMFDFEKFDDYITGRNGS